VATLPLYVIPKPAGPDAPVGPVGPTTVDAAPVGPVGPVAPAPEPICDSIYAKFWSNSVKGMLWPPGVFPI